MENELKIGDVVRLKSEKYNAMTVEWIKGNEAQCIYFDKDGVFKRITVISATLQKSGEQ